MPARAFALADAVRAVGIGHHREWLAQRDQTIDQHIAVLVVHVIVTRAVNQQKVAFQAAGMGDGRALLVALAVLRGPTHEPLLVDRVVVALIRDEGDGNSGLVKLGIAEDAVERHRAPAAPAPDAHSLAVDERPPLFQRLERLGLLTPCQDAHLAVNALTPGVATRSGVARVARNFEPPRRSAG